MSTTAKSNRFEVRVSPEEKETVEYAATLEGLTVSAYMRARILKAAKEDIYSQEKLLLSNSDRDIFLKALENPPQHEGKLKAAFAKFQKKYHKA
jgi:uncharacterized protein (DUF1778 family)